MEQRYSSQICDEQIRQLWQQQQTYRQIDPNFKSFTIDTPPPTISGSLHIGHIFSYTQTDLIARYKRMTGHNVFYPFGFDCNGLATERFVEKKHNTNVSKIGRQNFINLCLSTTEEMKVKFVELWRTMGLSAELEHTYSTIAANVAKIAQESFIILANKGFVYRKNEPALFCTLCRTTVAQAELDDLEQSTIFNDIQFTTTDNQKITIATTRPELMASCVAILHHPNDSRYQHLTGKNIIVPLFEQKVTVLADEQVLPEKGSGLVMVCTFGDKTDIEWYKKHNLAYKQSLGLDGKFLPEIPFIGGLKVTEARKVITEKLTEQELILQQKPIQNTVNVHERCKQPIEYAILPQWFVRLVDNKENFLKLSCEINWHPAHMKARFDDWVQNLSWDWCISRQRVFGIPFPVWYCNSCHEATFAPLEELPIDPQNSNIIKSCHACGSPNIHPEQDVMDTWNTSSLTPYICKQLYANNQNSPFNDNSFVPMSMRPQAHDIIRTWAFYTIAKSWMHQGNIPWKDIVISGYVLSENKEKISKSKNNAPTEPEKLLTQFPADAIRFWAASGTLGHDTAFSPEQMAIGQKLLTKLWNALKFVQINIQDKKISNHQPKLDLINSWIINSTEHCLKQYHEYFSKNEFSLALQSVEKVFWSDFCDNYIEIVKDQFFNSQNYSQEQLDATYWTLRETSFRILQLYAPFLPHITEYLYQHILKDHFKINSIHITQLQQAQDTHEVIEQSMRLILDIIAQVRKLKTAQQLSLKTEIATLTIGNLNQQQIKLIEQEMKLIQGVCKVAKIVTQKDSVSIQIVESDSKWIASVQIS
ncbi:valine--tRNA ligase [Candidatus Dependentiae bacterium]|nr:valine--tRNA ligase [Candidatus Dependentiae bacterium]